MVVGYYWIVQSGLKSDFVEGIVIDNPKSKSDFGFGLTIKFFNFNPNPKNWNCSIKNINKNFVHHALIS
jgi:hypothetical protein